MKKKIIYGITVVFLLVGMLFCLTGCGTETIEQGEKVIKENNEIETTKSIDLNSIYLEVLANKRAYVDESNVTTHISEIEQVNQIKYTFLDMDQDEKNEMVLMLEKNYDEDFLVLNYEEDCDTVYGFEVVLRGMLGLKTNGYYKASGGATVSALCKSTFDKNIRTETALAIMDDGIYSIENKRVSKSDYDEYIQNEYDSKEEVEWIKYEKNIK